MSARLTFAGSGDAFSGAGRFHTCFVLEADTADPLMIDCGATALTSLKRLDIDPSSIGHVLLSHLHGDHFAGLPWLILDGQFAKRTRSLETLGPPHTRERFEQAFEALYPGAKDAERRFETHVSEYATRVPRELGPARVTAYPVEHAPATMPHGLRVEYAGRVIAYSGDTEWTDTLLELAAGADLFICECNFFETRAPGHLDYRTLLSHRAEIECARIAIPHMCAEMPARLSEAEFEAAADGAVISV